METLLKLMPASIVQGWIVTAAGVALTGAATWLLTVIKNSHLSNQAKSALDSVTEAVFEVLQAEAKATNGKAPTMLDVPRLETTALAIVQARTPDIEKALEGELEAVIHHEVLLKTGNHDQIAPITAPVATATAAKPNGHIELYLLPLLTGLALAAILLAGPARAQSAWGAPTLEHGPSLPLLEIWPSNLHPISVLSGAGYSVGLGEGTFQWLGKPWTALGLSLQVFGQVQSPAGAEVGGLQAAILACTLSNTVCAGPVLTPYTALGGGFMQGGHPGTGWALSLTFPLPLLFGPNSAPTTAPPATGAGPGAPAP